VPLYICVFKHQVKEAIASVVADEDAADEAHALEVEKVGG
jgi:hypothetical protein